MYLLVKERWFSILAIILILVSSVSVFFYYSTNSALAQSLLKDAYTKFGQQENVLMTPIVNESQEIAASDGASGDEFGSRVAIDGNTAVVSSYGDDDNGQTSGSAYVFVKNGTTWTEQAKLTASDGTASALFGSVAIQGDTIIIGARSHSHNGIFTGSAYVFTRSGTTWTEQQELIASDAAGGASFGESVAMDGDSVVIGAKFDEGDGTAYVFTQSGSTWTQQSKLRASDGITNDIFGISVAIDGDTIAVGASGEDQIASQSGATYIFKRNGTNWSQQAKLIASDGAGDDRLGESVGVSGDTVITGAFQDSDNGSLSGSAYIFKRSGTTWTEQAKIKPMDGATGDQFGEAVVIKGNVAVISSQRDDDNGSNSGSVYTFIRSGTSWIESQKLLASNGSNSDKLGFSIAISGNTVVSGAIDKNSKGAAYFFDIQTMPPTCHPVKPDLISWWTGDGNNLDIRGRNDGTLNNGATYGTGKVEQGYSLDGVDDFVSTPHTPKLNFGTGAFSIETWVNFNSLAGEQILVEKYIETLNTNSTGFTLAKITGNRFLLAFTGGGTVTSGSQPLAINTWYHVAATRDAVGTVEIYLDGVSIVSGTNSANVDSTSSLKLGHRGNPTDTPGSNDTRGFYLNGLIDETSIYGRGLSSTEILAIYNADVLGKCKPTATVKPSGLVGWWAGDSDAKDVDGNESGTLQNGAGFAVSKVGQGFKFDGVDDYVSIPDSPANSVSTAITIEGWINPANAPTTFGTILSKYTSPTNNSGYSITLASNQTIQFGVYGNGTGTIQYVVNSILTIPLNQYTHVAGTFDTSTQTMKVYFDGIEVPTSTVSNDNVNPIFDSASEVRIGAIDIVGGGSTDQHFSGQIDEISLYNTALTATEIKSIFDAEIAGSLKTVATNPPAFSETYLRKDRTSFGVGVVTEVGDATLTFSNVTTAGTTQQIPLDPNDLPTLVNGTHTGLVYDISTSAVFSGSVDVCFNLPAFTLSNDFSNLRVLHLENEIWENRTTTSDFVTRTLCSNVATLSPFAIVQFAPSAASVTISGKVTTQSGRGVPRAIVHVTEPNGNIRTARTNQFGYYRFENVEVGQTMIFNVYSKQYQFQTQVVTINENIVSLNFVADN